MEINLQTGVTLPQALPGARSADTPAVQHADTATPVTPAPTVPAPQTTQTVTSDEKRLQQLQAAAQSFFKDVYAVSDTTFTIFKDSTGQYVTRFTSLRDGKVTYIPEPRLLQYAGAPRESLVEITA